MTIPDPRASVGRNAQPSDERIVPGRSSTTSAAQGVLTLGGRPASSAQATNESDRRAREATNLTGSPTRWESPRKTPIKRAKPAHPESCADLLRAVYSGKRKRLKPSEKALRKMRLGPKLQPAEREELLDLATQDRTLERTRELMLLSMERFDGPNLAGQVREFVRDLLMRHPAFQVEALADALRNLSEGPTSERAVKMLTEQPFDLLPWSEDAAALKKSELDKCRVNAACCLLLWHQETRRTSFEDISRSLRVSLWEPAAQRHKSETQKLRALMGNRDPAAAVISCSLLEKQAFDAEQQERVAREAEEKANTRVRELKGRLDDVERQLNAEKAQVERLTAELHAAQQTHENDIAHRRDEYAKLRGRVLHRIRRELSLLEDGLHALRRSPPKVNVMDDHAERAIDGLKREMQRLRMED